MAPRTYRMAARAESVAATKQRIVDAAIAEFSSRGTLATSWDDIAARAGVALATVYRHYPTLEDLVPACAQVAFDVVDIPTPEQAAARFADLPSAQGRLEFIVRESCHCYERGAEWLRAVQRDRTLVPAMAEAARRQDVGLEVLVRAALAVVQASRELVRVICVLINFPFWQALIDAGQRQADVPNVMLRLVIRELEERRRRR